MNIKYSTNYISNKYGVGTLFASESWGAYVILGQLPESRYAVRFIETGYITIAGSANIKKGAVKDYWMPHVYKVGYLSKGKYRASYKSKATRAYELWVGILERLYSGKYPTYKNIKLETRWANFQYFCEDIQKVEGFDLWRKHQGSYQIDKDLSGLGIYSIQGCKFISKSSNISDANVRTKTNTKVYTVINEKGLQFEVVGIRQFCREHSLNAANFHKVLKGKKSVCKGFRLIGGSRV